MSYKTKYSIIAKHVFGFGTLGLAFLINLLSSFMRIMHDLK